MHSSDITASPIGSHPHASVYLSGEKSPLSAGTPRHEADDARGKTGAYTGPSPLRKRLQQVADTALAEGITLPMPTTFELVRGEVGGAGAGAGDGGGDGGDGGDGDGGGGGAGMDFIVSVISSDALAAKVGDRSFFRGRVVHGWLVES